MTDHGGYALLPPGALPDTSQVIDTCRQLFMQKRALVEAMTSSSPKSPRRPLRKSSFLRDLLNDSDIQANPQLVDFALSDQLFSIVTNYLGIIPILNRVDLVYSIPHQTSNGHISSQLFHQDPEGLTQAKVFLNVFDVDKANGPFMFIPADHSERIVKNIRQQREEAGLPDDSRYRDDEVSANGGQAALLQLTGPAGAAAITDTSRCLHAGSRIEPGHFRLLLFLQYCTSREKTQRIQRQRFRNDPVRWLALQRHSDTD